MTSEMQQKYVDVPVNRPPNVKDDHWDMFVKHVKHGVRMTELASSYQISPTRVRVIISNVDAKVSHIKKWGFARR